MKRQEEKYFLTHEEVGAVFNHFQAAPTYPVRQINSVYFDTHGFDSFADSEEGVVPRSKYRYRWYGEANKISLSGALEIKITREHHREKTSRNITLSSTADLALSFRQLSPLVLTPICQVSYRRAYFENASGLRFTFDFDLLASLVDGATTMKIPKTVLEIKYSRDVPDAEYSSLLGDRRTRFSKYNEAVQTLRLL